MLLSSHQRNWGAKLKRSVDSNISTASTLRKHTRYVQCSTAVPVSKISLPKKHLLQGADVINRLIGVILRFGIQQTAVTCDIKEMSHSFHANREHRDLQRFPWFKDNNLNGDIEYRTIASLLREAWLFVSRQFWPLSTAESGQESFEQEPADFLKNDFYVDAGLKVLWYIWKCYWRHQ